MSFITVFPHYNGMKIETDSKEKNWKIHKYVIKQHTTEQPTTQRKIKRDIKKYLKTNKDGKRTYQNIQDGAKAILRRNSIVIQLYVGKQEKSIVNNLTLHPKELEKEEQGPELAERRK